jgi:hypothetical protein
MRTSCGGRSRWGWRLDDIAAALYRWFLGVENWKPGNPIEARRLRLYMRLRLCSTIRMWLGRGMLVTFACFMCSGVRWWGLLCLGMWLLRIGFRMRERRIATAP